MPPQEDPPTAHTSLRRNGLCSALACDFVEGQAGLDVNGVLAREGLPALDRDIDEVRLELERAGPAPDPLRRQDRRAEPQKVSSTMSPRRVQSFMASATSATGFTVGWDWRSSKRPARNVLTPA